MAKPPPSPPSPSLPPSIRDPLLSPSPSLNDLCYDISSIQTLARQGSWRSILEKVSHARKLSLLQSPSEKLAYVAYLVLAHMKLRNYGDAADELDTLADFESPQYQYQQYPSVYPGASGSMVPFVLRWLHAELPHRLGQTDITLQRLYSLFNHCRQHLDRLQVHKDLADLSVAPARENINEEFTLVSGADSSVSTTDLGDSHIPKIGPSLSVGSSVDLSPSPASVNALDSMVSEGSFLTNETSITASEPSQLSLDQVDTSLSPLERAAAGLSLDPLQTIAPGAVPEATGDQDRPSFGRVESAVAGDAKVDLLKEGKSISTPSQDFDQDFGEFVSGAVSSSSNFRNSRGADAIENPTFSLSPLARWQRRQEVVMNSIVSHHLNQKEFVISLKWLKRLILIHPRDPELLSKLGYVQMQLGDLTGAKDSFSKVEGMVSHGTTVNGSTNAAGLNALLCRNRGLQNVVLKQYAAAIKEFDAAMELDPADVVSANNKALCLMYSRDLIGSTKVLETTLEKLPVFALNESLVLNLCSMYELAFVNNVKTKRSLSHWILQVAPDDFDLSCTRL